MDLISVIIPVYNAGKYLRPCLDSVTGQTYSNLQIILINDGSGDNSLEICREYAEKDPRILLIDQKNSGVSAARNRGIAEAKGDWFSFIDSDDYLELDAYSHCMEIIGEHSCDAVCYEYFTTYPDREILHRMPPECYGLLDRRQSMHLLHGGLPFTWTRLFHRKLVDGVAFDTTICRGEDGKFNTEVLHRAETVFFTERTLYHYVQSDESACRGRFRPSQLTAVRLMDFYPDFFAENYPELLLSWNIGFLHLLISLYFDMYEDALPYHSEQKQLLEVYKQHYRRVDLKKISRKNRLKFFVFRYFTRSFCLLHGAILRQTS